MKQGQELIAKVAFTMKFEGKRGRPVNVKIGDRFWVTTTDYSNKTHAKIDRYGKGFISHGYCLSLEQISQLFEEV